MTTNKLFPIALMAALFMGCRYVGKDKFNDFYLSFNTTTILKGFFAFFVFFHHLEQYCSQGSFFLTRFDEYGTLSVGVFFFFSGYGLLKKQMSDEDYAKGFLKKRLFKLVLPYAFVKVVYVVYYWLIGTPVTRTEMVERLAAGDPLVSFSWFINEIIILYLLFYITIRTFKKNCKAIMVATCIEAVLLCLFFNAIGYKGTWTMSTHMFAMGMIWYAYESQLLAFIKKHYLALFIVFTVLTILCLLNAFSIEITQVLFMVFVLLVGLKIKINSRIMLFLGKISMEIYMIQGLAIKMERRFLDLPGEMTDFLFIICLDIFLAYVMNIVFKKINRLVLK